MQGETTEETKMEPIMQAHKLLLQAHEFCYPSSTISNSLKQNICRWNKRE